MPLTSAETIVNGSFGLSIIYLRFNYSKW